MLIIAIITAAFTMWDANFFEKESASKNDSYLILQDQALESYEVAVFMGT